MKAGTIRAGLQLTRGTLSHQRARNTGGTFTFASLDAYAAGQPTTARNVGDRT